MSHIRYIDRDKLWALFVDHYWDSFQGDRDLILSHINAVMTTLPDTDEIKRLTESVNTLRDLREFDKFEIERLQALLKGK